MPKPSTYTTAAGMRLAAVFCLSVAVSACQPAEAPPASEGSAPVALPSTPPAARLVIDYGDGVEKHFVALPWDEAATVADWLRAAADHARGIELESRGDGENFFVEAIDGAVGGVEIDGEPAFWTYRINGEKQTIGAGVRKIAPGDEVRWNYGPFSTE